MKKSVLVLSAAITGSAFAAQVDRVLVRQQWPWSSEVRVEYSVSGATAPAAVSLSFYNGATLLAPSDLTALKGDTAYAGNGMHVVTFDPKALFGLSDVDQFADFKVRVTLGEESELMGDKLYKIIDLDTGKITDLVRADFYNNKGYGTFETNFAVFGSGDWKTSLDNVLVWTGVTNNPIYKTDKIVMRRIAAKGETFTLGSDVHTASTPAHSVTLTNDYYLSVFEVTQAQMYKMTETYGYTYTDVANHELMPTVGRWDTIYGRPNTWPTGGHDVTMTRFFLALKNLVGGTIAFDFPTEAQWEFACRAGTTTKFYTGLDDETDRGLVGYRMNSGDGGENPSPVGCFLPNAFGLYDMLSNMPEWCLDYMASYPESGAAETDPVGPSSGSSGRVQRGCGFNTGYSTKTHATAYRTGVKPTANSNPGACRLWCLAD